MADIAKDPAGGQAVHSADVPVVRPAGVPVAHSVESAVPTQGAAQRGAYLVLLYNQSVLLTRKGDKPYTIPGGRPQKGEGPSSALGRVLKEELPSLGDTQVNALPWLSFSRRGSFYNGRIESVFFLSDSAVLIKRVVAACRRDNVPYKWLDLRTSGDRESAADVDSHFSFLRSAVWELAQCEDERADHYSERGVWPGPVVLLRPLDATIGHDGWQPDLTADGDVEPNPGPLTRVSAGAHNISATANTPVDLGTLSAGNYTISVFIDTKNLERTIYLALSTDGTVGGVVGGYRMAVKVGNGYVGMPALTGWFTVTSGGANHLIAYGTTTVESVTIIDYCLAVEANATNVTVTNWPSVQSVSLAEFAAQTAPLWTAPYAPGLPVIATSTPSRQRCPPPSYVSSAEPARPAPRVHTRGTTATSSGLACVEWDPGPFHRVIKGLKRGEKLGRLPRAGIAPVLAIVDKPITLTGASTGSAILNDVWAYRMDLLDHLRRKAGDGEPNTDREICAAVAYTILADYNPFDLLPLEFGSAEDSVFEDCEEAQAAVERESDKAETRETVPSKRKSTLPTRSEAAAQRPRRSLATPKPVERVPPGSVAAPVIPEGVSAAQCAKALDHGDSARRDHNSWLLQVAKVALRIKDVHMLLCWALGTGAPQKFIDAVIAKWKAEHDLKDFSDTMQLVGLVEKHCPLIEIFDAAMAHDHSALKAHWAYDAMREYIADAPVSATNPVHAAGISRGDLLVGVELNPGPEESAKSTTRFPPAPRVDSDIDNAPALRTVREASSQSESVTNRWGPIPEVLTRLSTLTPGVNPLAGNLSSVVGFSSRLSLPNGTITAPFAIPPPVTNLLPRAYFPVGGGAAVAATARPRWLEVADVNRRGAQVVQTQLGAALSENVDAAASQRKNVNTLLFNGFPGGDLTNFDLGNALEMGLNLEAFFLKLWLYYFSDTAMSGSNARNRFGVMAQNADPNHTPVPANAVAYSVNTGAIFGEACGGADPNFPGIARDVNATLQLHISLSSVAPGDIADVVAVPPGLIRGHLDPNAALAMYIQGIAPYPCCLPSYTVTGTDSAGANATAVRYIPYSALVRINGKRQIRLYLPRIGGDGTAIGNVAQATAVVGAQIRTGPFATGAYAAGTPMNVYAVGAVGTPVILSDYLRSWSSNATNTSPAIAPNLRLSFIKEVCRLFPGAVPFAQSAYHKAVALSWRITPTLFQAPGALHALPAEALETAPCTLCGRIPPVGAADADADLPHLGPIIEIPSVQNNVFNGLALGMLVFAKAEPCTDALPPWSADNLFPHYALWDYVAHAASWDVWYGSVNLDVQSWTDGRTANATLEIIRQISLRSWNTSDDDMSNSIRHARCGLIAAVSGSQEPWADGSMPYAASLIWTDSAPFKPVYRVTDGPAFTAMAGVVPQRIADVWVFLTCPLVPREYLPRIPGGTWGPLKWRDWKNCSHATPVGGWSPPYPPAARDLLWRTDVPPPCDDVWRYNNALAWEAGVTEAGPLSPLTPTWLAGGAAVTYALPPSTDVFVVATRPVNPCLPTHDPMNLSPPTQPRNWIPSIDADGRVVWLVFASAGGNAQAMALWGAEQRGTSTYAWAYSGMVQQQIATAATVSGIDAALVSMFRAASHEPSVTPAETAGLGGPKAGPGVPQQ